MVGELRWGSMLRGVWEGILIQHATHDVGPTMTAPIPALIFHRFYSRPFPSPFVRLCCLFTPLLPLSFLFSIHLSHTTAVSLAPPPAATTRNHRSCHHGNTIFYTVKPVCLSGRPRLISSFQNRNVMGRRR